MMHMPQMFFSIRLGRLQTLNTVPHLVQVAQEQLHGLPPRHSVPVTIRIFGVLLVVVLLVLVKVGTVLA